MLRKHGNSLPRIFTRILIAVAIGLSIHGIANAQSANVLEMQCFSDIQGKVAWNKEGANMWDVERLKTLCKGTSNPKATAYCVTGEIALHNDWNKAIEECRSKLLPSPTSVPNAETPPNTIPPVRFGSLLKVISDGCSCSAPNLFDKTRPANDPGFLFITDLGDDSPAYFNIDGVDIKFVLKTRGERPDVITIGSTYEDTYEAEGMIAKIKYVDRGSSCVDDENCESRDYKITVSVSRRGSIRSITTPGTCGC